MPTQAPTPRHLQNLATKDGTRDIRVTKDIRGTKDTKAIKDTKVIKATRSGEAEIKEG